MNQNTIRPDSDNMDSVQGMIIQAFANAVDPHEIIEMLNDYEQEFGMDTFWKLTYFDAAELLKDHQLMQDLMDQFEAGEISPVLYQIHQARIYYLLEDFQKALDCLNETEALEDNEEALMYLHIKGICAFAVHDFELAVQCLEDVLMDYDDVQIQAFTALAYLKMEKTDRADEYLSEIDEKLQDQDISWLYDLLVHFKVLDTLQDPHFPKRLREKIKAEADEDLNMSLDELEKMISQDPEKYESFIRTALLNEPDDHVLIYLNGVLSDLFGDHAAANKYYRQAMLTPNPDGLDTSEMTACLEVRLFALRKLDYTNQTVTKHLKNMASELRGCPSCLIDLMAFCAIDNHINVLKHLITTYGIPKPRCSGEEVKLDDSLLALYMENGDYYSAYNLLKSKLRLHMTDLYFSVTAGLIFAMYQPHFHPEFETADEYDDFRAYLQDQIVYCELLREFDDGMYLAKLNELIDQLHAEIRSERYPDWMEFLTYMKLMADHIHALKGGKEVFARLNQNQK